MSTQKIQIQSLCKHHSLPFVSICITNYCQCQVKLCEKCLTEHESQNQNSNLMRMENFYTKIQTQLAIVNKQSQKLINTLPKQTAAKTFQESKQKLDIFALNQVKVLEESMRYLNEESGKVNEEISEASVVLKTKINKIEIKRRQLPENFCKKVLQNNMIQSLITFYNQKGFISFRKKLDKTLQFRAIIKEFLTYAQKFGKEYKQFMNSSSPTISKEWSMKSTINDILKNKKCSQKPQIKSFSDNNQTENISFRINNLLNQQGANQQLRQKRARTIFGKY